MQNNGNATLYHHYYCDGKYKCTAMEALETAKQYKLTNTIGYYDRVTFRSTIKKDELDKLFVGSSDYEMYSTVPNLKLFGALLFDNFKINRAQLQQEIVAIDKQLQIIATMGQ